MDEILRPEEDMLSALATQMGLPTPEPEKPRNQTDKKPPTPPYQKSYSQLT